MGGQCKRFAGPRGLLALGATVKKRLCLADDVTQYFMLILKASLSNGEKYIESFHLSTEAIIYHLDI